MPFSLKSKIYMIPEMHTFLIKIFHKNINSSLYLSSIFIFILQFHKLLTSKLTKLPFILERSQCHRLYHCRTFPFLSAWGSSSSCRPTADYIISLTHSPCRLFQHLQPLNPKLLTRFNQASISCHAILCTNWNRLFFSPFTSGTIKKKQA